MRASVIQIALAVGLLSGVAVARDLSSYEKQCAEIGFKKGTQAYGECVLELDRRASGSSVAQSDAASARANLRGDGTPDDSTCAGYGFSPGTEKYADCRMTLDLARRDYQQKQAAYQAEQARYEQQLAAAKAEEERQRRLRQAEYWFRMSAAASQPGATIAGSMAQAGQEMLGVRKPEPPTQPSGTTIYVINGKHIVCNDLGNGVITCN